MKVSLLLIKNEIKPSAKSVLVPLRLTSAASAVDRDIHKKVLGCGTATLIISNEEINDIMKLVKFLGKSSLLIESVSELIKCLKRKKGGFLGFFLVTLGLRLLGNVLSDKVLIRAGEGTIRVDESF